MKNFITAGLLVMLYALADGASAQVFVKDIDVPAPVTVNPQQIKEDWQPSIQHLEMPLPGGPSTRSELLELKKEVQKSILPSVKKSRNSLLRPGMKRNFEGNAYNQRVPNDNDLAISNDGHLVSVINSTIYMFDVEDDSLLASFSLSAFASSLGNTQSMYDPKVVYDPGNDRFVMVWLAGFLDSTSSIIISFSTSSDPSQPWNVYELPGNPLNNSTWSDYPVIGLSAYELFIGINTFTNGSTNNSGFTESCFWQIRLRDGYQGAALETRYYNNILQPAPAIFNICPVQGGSQLYGPDMYLLSNRNLSAANDTIFLLHVTDTINGVNEGLQVQTLSTPKRYHLPVTARQAFNHTFDTNDSRILGAFLENGRIQYVQSATDTTNGRVAVYHGVISSLTSQPVLDGWVYSDPQLDLGFPNIAYAGSGSADHSAIITVNHTDSTRFSGCSAFNTDGQGGYSDLVTIKEGLNYVHILLGVYERWGDYSGSQRKYDEPGTIWMAGSFGTSNWRHGTWIAEVNVSDGTAVTEREDPANDMQLFPVPAGDIINLNFNAPGSDVYKFMVMNMQGKVVKVILEEYVKKGGNQFSFSTSPLPAGVYVISAVSHSGHVSTMKFVKH